jgi:hypothetical protein
MFDTGCSPGNYMSLAFFHANADVLKDYLIPCPAERVDLATSNSSQSITKHLVMEVRHVDTRGVTRTIKLRFGVLDGLRCLLDFYTSSTKPNIALEDTDQHTIIIIIIIIIIYLYKY